jgi:DNA gyrase/topoisomerase IV subunit A
LDEPLLLASSHYRFFLTTAENLIALEQIGLDLAAFLQLSSGEHISAISRWETIKKQSRLVLISSQGYARSYKMNGVVELIEGSTPHQFDQPLPGLPLAVFGAEPADHFVIIMDSGRAVRYGLEDIPIIGLQAINRRQGERISGVSPVQAGKDIVLVTAGGFGRRLPAEWIPVPSRPNSRGRVVVARRPLAGLASMGAVEALWAVSNQRMWALNEEQLELSPTDSTRTRRLLKLAAKERILTVFSQ